MTLFPPDDWSDNDINARFYRTIWKNTPEPVKECVVLCVRELESANRFEHLIGTRPHMLPTPLGPIGRRNIVAKPAAEGPMVVSYLGGARLERGAAFVADVVRQCASPAIRFFIQAKAEVNEFDIAPLLALRGLPNVHVHEGALNDDAYYDAMAESLVLLPYSPQAYGVKSSGVYVEAKFLGAPAIVPAGSGMAEDVERLGNGVVFGEFDVASMADGIRRAQRELPALRAAAAAAGVNYRQHNGADRCVDALEALFETTPLDGLMAP